MIKRIIGILLTFVLITNSFLKLDSYCANAINSDMTKNENTYNSLNDSNLLKYVEDSIYENAINALDSDMYFVENVKAVYISKEYIEELDYNSKKNIYFGYTLQELDEQFQGKKYYFTVDDNGKTVVKEVENISDDDSYNKIIKNVAIGTGVILICVTVSAVTAGAGAPAVSMIFAASAKSATTFALSSGAIGGMTAGIAKGIETGDVKESVKAGLLAGSEGFKWGAVSGAVIGGAGKAVALHGATLNGLTMNEAAVIQRESGYPLDVIKQFKSMDQYNICKDAGLTTQMVNGKLALVRDIDLKFVDDEGRTNLERMQKGLAAIDPNTGLSYELHHVGQKMDSTLAILTESEHMQGGNNAIWHNIGNESEINRALFAQERMAFWRSLAKLLGG